MRVSACFSVLLYPLTGYGKNHFGRHSERNEESLFDKSKGLRGILRARPALRITLFRLFPQPAKSLKTLVFNICKYRVRLPRFIDTVEVCGSSPHGPTILFNTLERFLRIRQKLHL
jgi:hypothetical protein